MPPYHSLSDLPDNKEIDNHCFRSWVPNLLILRIILVVKKKKKKKQWPVSKPPSRPNETQLSRDKTLESFPVVLHHLISTLDKVGINKWLSNDWIINALAKSLFYLLIWWFWVPCCLGLFLPCYTMVILLWKHLFLSDENEDLQGFSSLESIVNAKYIFKNWNTIDIRYHISFRCTS